MNIDDRLEAIAMNLELVSRDTHELQAMTRANTEAIAASAAAIAANAAAIAANNSAIGDLRITVEAQRDLITGLIENSANLAVISQALEGRVRVLERKSA